MARHSSFIASLHNLVMHIKSLENSRPDDAMPEIDQAILEALEDPPAVGKHMDSKCRMPLLRAAMLSKGRIVDTKVKSSTLDVDQAIHYVAEYKKEEIIDKSLFSIEFPITSLDNPGHDDPLELSLVTTDEEIDKAILEACAEDLPAADACTLKHIDEECRMSLFRATMLSNGLIIDQEVQSSPLDVDKAIHDFCAPECNVLFLDPIISNQETSLPAIDIDEHMHDLFCEEVHERPATKRRRKFLVPYDEEFF